MAFELSEEQQSIQREISRICDGFPMEYWIDLDSSKSYPVEFLQAMIEAGWTGMLIPEAYGGGGASYSDAAVVIETINRRGGTSSVVEAQMYTMGTVLRHGSDEQKQRYLPDIAAGKLRLQSFAVTEPDAGTDTTRISTFARRSGDEYIISGKKMFTSRFRYTDLMLLLTRTTPYDEVTKKTDGMSTFLVDVRDVGDQIVSRPIDNMLNHHTYELFIDDLRVPAENLIGIEGEGFSYILSGMNAERVLLSSKYIGSGHWFIDRASNYAAERVVFGRPIGQNQGVQFPLAEAHLQLEAASLMRWQAADLFERGEQPGFEANAAKFLSSKALWAAANAAMDTFGGYGVTTEFGIERKFREARLPLVAPVNNNAVLAHVGSKVLGMPRSY